MPDAIRLQLPGGEAASVLRDLAAADVLGQLLRREGRMRELATEGDDVKLDWVDGVEKGLGRPDWLAAVESEAAELLRAGIRHVIWAGMGGSVQTVYALCRIGFFARGVPTVHPLDSTDPATLNLLLARLLELEGHSAADVADSAVLRDVLGATAMVGVSMGMTSEEPITHLEWFDGLLHELGVPDPGKHIQVMTLPGSYLDRFARPRGSKMVPIQLDGENHTAGRMSSPATRVFLRPAALRVVADSLAAGGADADGSGLAAVLRRCEELSGLSHRQTKAEREQLTPVDSFVRLGAWFAANAAEGRNKALVLTPPAWVGFVPWLEQLVEESLGKGGKGLLVFYDQAEDQLDRLGPDVLPLEIRIGGVGAPAADRLRAAGRAVAVLEVPLGRSSVGPAGLGEFAALCLGFERMVAVFGYLQGIVFAGQPAVESYKRYARELRDAPGAVMFQVEPGASAKLGCLTLHYQTPFLVGGADRAAFGDELARLGTEPVNAAGALAALISLGRRAGWLRYLDFTFNGELTGEARRVLAEARDGLANGVLGVPAKLRTGPSDYHSTEQSETDGPAELLSVRLVALEHAGVGAGQYSDKFLLAQARGTWQAMEDAGRWTVMLTTPRLDETALADLGRLLGEVSRLLAGDRRS